MLRGTLKSWLTGTVLLGTLGYAIAEDVTVTTYYPSPRGIYKQIQTTDDTFLATQGGGVGIGTTAPSTGKLVVLGGNVGIGTSSPGAALHVVSPTTNLLALELQGTPDRLNILRGVLGWSFQPSPGGIQSLYFGPVTPGPFSVRIDGDVSLIGGSLTFQDGTQQAGRVLTAVDNTGLASWQSKTLDCTTVVGSGTVQCDGANGYIVTGCGTYASSEDDQISGNGCTNNEGAVWAQCCRF